MSSKPNRDPARRSAATAEECVQPVVRDRNLLLFEIMRAHIDRKGSMVVRGVAFENCQIEGPAVLLPVSGCNFDDCNFNATDGDMTTLILYPASSERVTGVIAMIDCTFHAVDFLGVGFTGAKPFLDSLLAVETRTGDPS